MEAETSWILVSLLTAEPGKELPLLCFKMEKLEEFPSWRSG